MLKSFPTKSLTFVASLLLSNVALADINTSLENACTKVEKQPSAALHEEADQAKQAYATKLASFFANASCNGKQLIVSAQLNNASQADMLVETDALN